jgi:hypothetical protein
MALFRILHASDLHMGAVPKRPGKYWHQASHHPAPLKAIADFANANRTALNGVLLTGDLATTGALRDLEAAYDFCTAAAANPAVSQTPAGDPTLVHWRQAGLLDLLPGNHDRFRSKRYLYRPGGTVFDQVFCAGPAPRLWHQGRRVAHGLVLQQGNSILHILKADFTLRHGDHGQKFYMLPGWFGQGRVEQPILDQLVDATEQARNYYRNLGSLTTLWAIHFDPFTTDETLKLLDSELLAQAAQKLRIPAILCGHTHETKLKALSDATFVFVCGTAAQVGSPHWDCQVIEITTDDYGQVPPTFRVQWYRYQQGKLKFLQSL